MKVVSLFAVEFVGLTATANEIISDQFVISI